MASSRAIGTVRRTTVKSGLKLTGIRQERKSGRRVTLRCLCDPEELHGLTNGIFAEEVMKAIPMRRFGKPEEVAAAVKYLMSDEAAYVTRQVIQVNGGMF